MPVGPSLDSYGLSGRKQNGLVLFFRDPDRVVPGSIMPVLHGTDRQLRSLALYMLSLKTQITPTAALGRRIFTQRNCGYCHGGRAEGVPLGPRLAGSRRKRTDAWLLEHFLAPAIVAGRETMPRVWASDWELQALLEYLKTLWSEDRPRRRGERHLHPPGVRSADGVASPGQGDAVREPGRRHARRVVVDHRTP
jgi:cbb3-type cytochrome oxidase cytochrome c subunit